MKDNFHVYNVFPNDKKTSVTRTKNDGNDGDGRHKRPNSHLENSPDKSDSRLFSPSIDKASDVLDVLPERRESHTDRRSLKPLGAGMDRHQAFDTRCNTGRRSNDQSLKGLCIKV